MKFETKKILFTLLDIAVLLLALYWVSWLCYYYTATIDGSVFIKSAYYIFERNYLVPIQIFGITAVLTVMSIILYKKFRRENLIGRKYIILVIFHILPFCIIGFLHIGDIMSYWERIY